MYILKLTKKKQRVFDLPSLSGYSPVMGDVVVEDKGVHVSGRKGGPLAVGSHSTAGKSNDCPARIIEISINS